MGGEEGEEIKNRKKKIKPHPADYSQNSGITEMGKTLYSSVSYLKSILIKANALMVVEGNGKKWHRNTWLSEMCGTDHFSFLSTDIAVVEMSDAFRQPSLFYHLGVRESFSMANNIILYCDTNSESLQSLKVAMSEKVQEGKSQLFCP